VAVTEIGINYEPAIGDLVMKAIAAGLASIVEIIPDGYAHDQQDELRALLAAFRRPYVFHFVDNSLGSADFATNNNLRVNARMVKSLRPMHVSDHLTFCRAGNLDLKQNLAVPRTRELAQIFVNNIKLARRRMGAEFLIENIGGIWEFEESTMEPSEFYRNIVIDSASKCLLDLHNLYVDELNFGTDPVRFIEALPPELVVEVHVAGGTWNRARTTYHDSHDDRIPARVFELLDLVLARTRPAVVVLERVTAGRDLRRLSREIWRDLEQLNELNDSWNQRWQRRRRSNRSAALSSAG
jgi:uncharacterized protein (UPF0276 family)